MSVKQSSRPSGVGSSSSSYDALKEKGTNDEDDDNAGNDGEDIGQ